RTTGEPGDMVAVGAELVAFETTTDVKAAASGTPPPLPSPPTKIEPGRKPEASVKPVTAAKVITSPAIRKRAQEAGIDLSNVQGSGARGRILRSDLDAALTGQPAPDSSRNDGVGDIDEIKVIGVRRLIANRMQASKREIPHFAYVEEVDVTALEALRKRLNESRQPHQQNLTYLPFIALALIRSLPAFPHINAHFDTENGVLKRYRSVHLGIATQTPDGLKVPVVHDAHVRGLWDLATEINRVATAARENTAQRGELTGSTITITSLGRLGGIVTTPVINAPEVAIIGVNKAVKRPTVIDDNVVIRLMMNLSSSFDHRFVDGFDAASMIQNLKNYLEEPATIFINSG
ncbi:MAG: dihydrolipoamide acetyltransferase family protein, partial [Gammaproteobacteria bacterium]|nr:dihydrolipoamide acetyltransferase family protein [Gammaproteobacteria bacterium]